MINTSCPLYLALHWDLHIEVAGIAAGFQADVKEHDQLALLLPLADAVAHVAVTRLMQQPVFDLQLRAAGERTAHLYASVRIRERAVGIGGAGVRVLAAACGGDGFGLHHIGADGTFLVPAARFGFGGGLVDDPLACDVGSFVRYGPVIRRTRMPVVRFVKLPVRAEGMGVAGRRGGYGKADLEGGWDTVCAAHHNGIAVCARRKAGIGRNGEYGAAAYGDVRNGGR